MPSNLRQKITLSLGFAALVYLALTLYADAPKLALTFLNWNWRWLLLTIPAVLANYLVRAVRWHYYLHVIGADYVPPRASLLIFLSGFSLTMVPGKLGELVKSILLKSHYDVPITRSAPIIAVERLTDVLGMLFLAALGLSHYPLGVPMFALVLAGTSALILLIQVRALADYLLTRVERLPVVGRFAHVIRNLYESTYVMLQWRPLLIALALSVVAWFGECLALLFILLGFGLAPTFELLLQATFIYAAASLFGAALMLPGGLGATEGSMALLLQQVVSVAHADSVAATLIVRLCTLWLAVLLGVIAVLALGTSRPSRLSQTWKV
jgi:uncharacterized protein (TIRG00374 family)